MSITGPIWSNHTRLYIGCPCPPGRSTNSWLRFELRLYRLWKSLARKAEARHMRRCRDR